MTEEESALTAVFHAQPDEAGATIRATACSRRKLRAMYRHDFILRLIERFGTALRSLRDRILRREREDLSARAEIVEIAQQAGLDLAVARTLTPDLLLMWLAPTGEVDAAKFWLMAELLYLDGLDARASGGEGWRAGLERASTLLTRLDPSWRPGDRFTSAGERVAEIKVLLDPAEA